MHHATAILTTTTPRMPHQLPEIEHDDDDNHGVQSFPSFADQQLEHERAEEAARDAAHKASKDAHKATTKAGESAKDFGKKAESKGEELKKKAGAESEELKKKASAEGKKVKQEAKEAEDWADKNKGNPVVIGNVVAIAALGGLLGFGAYKKYNAGELTWKVAGAWAGVVGLFAAGDYYVSQYVSSRWRRQ